ncbi:hypothetical protein Tco_0109878 [Tanacetum coccineum]
MEFTSEYGIPESLHPELFGPEKPIVEFSEGKVGVYTKFFEFANYRILVSQFLFDILGYYQIHLSQLSMIDMDLFNLISAPDPAKVKTGMRPRAAHEVLLLTFTASHMIAEMGGTKDQAYEIPPVEAATTTEVVQEPGLEKEVAAMGPPVNKRCRKKGNDDAEANAPPKVLRRDHAASRPAQSTLGGKSLAAMGLEADSIISMPATQDTPTTAKSVSDPDPLSYAKPQPSSRKTTTDTPTGNVATTEVQDLFSAESPESGKSTPFLSVDGSPGGIYQPGWGVTNNYRLDTPDACQDMVDHIAPPGYFSKLRHLPNTDFLSQYNINLARQVAMGSQLRLRFEQEVRLLKKATTKIARRDQRIQAKDEEIKKLDQEIKSLRTVETKVHGLRNQTKNLETLLEAEADMRKATEAKNARLAKELESLCI